MTKLSLKKEKISIQNIGQQRFWIGVGAGLFSSISMSLIFNYIREAFRLLTSLSSDLLVPAKNEFIFYNYAFAALATTLGFSITVWIWMSSNFNKRKKDRYYKLLLQINTLPLFWIILMLFARFGTILTTILFCTAGYDNHLNFYEDYWALFVLIPLVIFLQNWIFVRLVYRSGKWILLSAVICGLMIFILQLTTSVNQEKMNNIYFEQYETDYQYIDEEVYNAKIKYGIEFDANTIDVLKKWKNAKNIPLLRKNCPK